MSELVKDTLLFYDGCHYINQTQVYFNK